MDFQNNVVNIITDLVKSVPIYQYECLPDKSAVDFLKKQIMEDNKKIKFKEDWYEIKINRTQVNRIPS